MVTKCLSCTGVRLYHTVTSLPGTGIVVFGGRSSPDKPIQGLCKVTFDPSGPCRNPNLDSEDVVKLRVEPVVSTGNPPSARWRHTTSVVSHKGEFKCTVGVFSSVCVIPIVPILNKIHCNKPSLFSHKAKTSCLSTVEKHPRKQSLVTVFSWVKMNSTGLRFVLSTCTLPVQCKHRDINNHHLNSSSLSWKHYLLTSIVCLCFKGPITWETNGPLLYMCIAFSPLIKCC